MDPSSEVIFTKHPNKRKGVKIEKDAYETVASLILKEIELEKDTTLASLIRVVKEQRGEHPEIADLVYHVKLDLEARGYIKLVPSQSNPTTKVLLITPEGIRSRNTPELISRDIPNSFGSVVDKTKLLLYNLHECPDSYLKSFDRDEYYEMVWFEYSNQEDIAPPEREHSIYLIPPYRSAAIPLEDKAGHLIAFRREYLDEAEIEFGLEVLNLFYSQGHHTLLHLDKNTQNSLNHLHSLMTIEYQNPQGSYVVLKSLLKVFLLHLIRLNRTAFIEPDYHQTVMHKCFLLVDQYHDKERKASFYARKIGVSEKKLNHILQERLRMTITQLIHLRIVLTAKRKLIAGEQTVKEISEDLSFEDHSYFSRFFKIQTGLTPDEFINVVKLEPASVNSIRA